MKKAVIGPYTVNYHHDTGDIDHISLCGRRIVDKHDEMLAGLYIFLMASSSKYSEKRHFKQMLKKLMTESVPDTLQCLDRMENNFFIGLIIELGRHTTGPTDEFIKGVF